MSFIGLRSKINLAQLKVVINGFLGGWRLLKHLLLGQVSLLVGSVGGWFLESRCGFARSVKDLVD